MEMTKLAPWNWFKSEQESNFPRSRSLTTFGRDPFETMRMEMRRLADTLDPTFTLSTPSAFGTFFPAIDVKDEGSEYLVSVEIPGVDKKDVKLQIDNGIMMIEGHKEHESKEESKNFYRRECSYGSFQRTLNLPLDADEERVSAKFKNGMLDIHIAKSSESHKTHGRQVSIQ